MTDVEEIVRVCSLGAEGGVIPIDSGPKGSVCKWIVITRVAHRWPDGEDPWVYVIYFVRPDGSEIDFPQRDTLQEALDTASPWAGIDGLSWMECVEALPNLAEDDPFPVDLLTRLCESAG